MEFTSLQKQGHGFAVFPEARIYKSPGVKSIQHLILGDYISPPRASASKKWEPEHSKVHEGKIWVNVHSRQEDGWMLLSDIQPNRVLEINFVDIGQGDGCHVATPNDEHIIIDAGETDNMYRFLRWRFNLKGISKPLPSFSAIISHSDEDHFKGFGKLFANPTDGLKRKLPFKQIYHNTIIQRPGSSLGDSAVFNGVKYLTDFTDTKKKLTTIMDKADKKSKYQQLLSDTLSTNKDIKIDGLYKIIGEEKIIYDDGQLKLEVLAPIAEKVTIAGSEQYALRWFADDVGKTKNGHSVVIMAHIGKLKVLLGGDLNSKSADFIMSQYSGQELEVLKASLEKAKTEQAKAKIQKQIDAVVEVCRPILGCDVAKSCHHGSHDITNEFLRVLNPIATVISSGDEESFCHPRPETLGAIGKYSRGDRPLIYSTELSRSSPEYLTLEMIKVKTDKEKQRLVSTYGMIALRSDGKNTIITQKLEKPTSRFGLIVKWQIDKLIWNDERQDFVSKH